MYLLPKAGGGEAQVTVAVLCSNPFLPRGLLHPRSPTRSKKVARGHLSCWISIVSLSLYVILAGTFV